MRMHPGVSYPLERIVPEGGVELCGVHLPAGTVVGMNAAVVHRNYEIFGQDADEFRPERWLCSEEQAKNMDRHLLTRALSFEVDGGAVESDISVPEPGLNLHLGMRRKIVIIAKVDAKEGGAISPVPDGSLNFSSGRAAFLGEGVARCRDGQLEAVPSGCIEEWDAANNWSTHGLTRFEIYRVIGRNR
ncbi:hypothetical protein COL154_013597 [Colletotrichum chrysophilum]|uniref:uncharacterized protein n=1 Tax=Colletotrichum chrysophilum TaxID=1836956 RepID=UPI002300A2D1|nr:uncharacterized protein COL26b_004955 [Colletotrichum chrysophilum]KAJ0349362.1 hypothetical protein COL154_013597 [Colletotrichum chrysophilum]KAJ0376899.1 hypothetical protein COL26b_004955 [Colletotrichum chrysophilum]